jgi:hypothetical protein
VSRRKPKAEPAKLAKVIPFLDRDDDEARADADWHAADAAIRAMDENTKKHPGMVPGKALILELREKVDRALASLLAVKRTTERGLGTYYSINAENAAFLQKVTAQIHRCLKARDWCVAEAKRYAPDAQIFNLAEFRRFRNRVVSKGATP